MDKTELLAIFDREQRRDDVSPDSLREVTPHVVRHVPRHADARWGWVIYSQLAGADVDAVIQEQIAYFSALGFNFEWKWYSHDEPPDLPARLISHGFEPEDPESLLFTPRHRPCGRLQRTWCGASRTGPGWRMLWPWKTRCGEIHRTTTSSTSWRRRWRMAPTSSASTARMWAMFPPARRGFDFTPEPTSPACGAAPPWRVSATRASTRRCWPSGPGKRGIRAIAF